MLKLTILNKSPYSYDVPVRFMYDIKKKNRNNFSKIMLDLVTPHRMASI